MSQDSHPELDPIAEKVVPSRRGFLKGLLGGVGVLALAASSVVAEDETPENSEAQVPGQGPVNGNGKGKGKGRSRGKRRGKGKGKGKGKVKTGTGS